MFGYALFMGDKEMSVKYPLEDFSEDVAGRCFHHGELLQRACTTTKSSCALSLVRLDLYHRAGP